MRRVTELTRTIRFCLSQDGTLASDASPDNTFAAWPTMRGLGRYYELLVNCRGEVNAETGFFMNIKEIDEAARTVALPLVAGASTAGAPVGFGTLLRGILSSLASRLPEGLEGVELRLTPTYSVRMSTQEMGSIYLSQSYEFSAAHRLHAQAFSEEENRRVYGKCNNPAGHGHNYRLEVTVRCPVDAKGSAMEVEKLDALVRGAVIDKLDHKRLDTDVREFAGVVTTVENIARVVYGMLEEPLKQAGAGLDQVRVWETGKTVCTYRSDRARAC